MKLHLIHAEFKKLFIYVETQVQETVKNFRADSGNEYMSHEFQKYLQQKGILFQLSCPNTLQLYGMA